MSKAGPFVAAYGIGRLDIARTDEKAGMRRARARRRAIILPWLSPRDTAVLGAAGAVDYTLGLR